ncbi:hypothetical protein JCGZ_14400 [Jatropha curcas]|uniref:BHLH domain-containing protein n=2 Tax=Jatropha curcas TaxID=180498 RepID=A0A067K9Y9_JATCU|nr:hypothetical protein JCGZ_14400 [Jatropha curcas]
MADTLQSHEAASQKLRKQLEVAVRSIQWSYAIFWSLSTTKQGVLEWAGGYYNGDIKTMKTVQEMELKCEKIGLQRSEQLRELYESLLEGETEQQAERPSVTLSPEDLCDAEWYYLVCMSFQFNTGEGLPGRALANKEIIWLCNAQYADNKVFSRSLLAKSASIQTVVCFSHHEGVIELGVTELVEEDPNLIQHVKASLLDFSKPVCAQKSSFHTNSEDNDKGPVCVQVDHKIVDPLAAFENTPAKDTILSNQVRIHEGLNMESPNDCEQNHQTQDSILEDLNGRISRLQSWLFMDDEINNGILDSTNSSDCISEGFANEEKTLSCPMEKNEKLQNGNNDLHYRTTLSVVLTSSTKLIGQDSCFFSGNCKSSFVSWKKGVFNDHRSQVHQNMLKKILFTVPLMYDDGDFIRMDKKENGGRDCLKKTKRNEICNSVSDKQTENEKFLVLKSMFPSVGEMDKALVLDGMIRYLKELEARVEELESCTDCPDYTERPRRNYLNVAEETSDNYGDKKIENGKKLWMNKRKASEIFNTDLELTQEESEDSLPSDVKVCVREKEVLIEMRCAYREYILLDIMDEINHLHLDVLSVQSLAVDGILTLTLKSKFRNAAIAPAGMIKQALRKVGSKC